MFLASKYIVMIFLITSEICLEIMLGQDFSKLIVAWKGFPDGSVIKNLPANAGDVGSIPGSEKSPGESNGNPLFLPGKSHGQRSLAGCSPWGSQKNQTQLND